MVRPGAALLLVNLSTDQNQISEGDDRLAGVLDSDRDVLITVPATTAFLTPVMLTIPLQFLAYYVAVRRECDVDQPRNLAKSVTVE